MIPTDSIPSEPLDQLGRPVRDLRISVIDKCNLRCTYCMPASQYHEGYKFLPESELLSFDEIERAARGFVALGVTKLRITGGEPLLRRDVHKLVEKLANIEGAKDIALTTNGLLLAQHVQALRDAGLNRLTISLDALDDETVGTLNGRGKRVDEIYEGIHHAEAAGFRNIKINAVVQRGVNDHAPMDLIEHFRGTGHVVRFIEFMDVGNRNQWKREQVFTSREIHDLIHARYPLSPLTPNYRGEVATRYAFDDGQGEIGFISSISEPFCGDCTRARISADGRVYTCLFATEGTSLRDLLRGGASDDELQSYIATIWRNRSDRYSELRDALQKNPSHKVEMYEIGG